MAPSHMELLNAAKEHDMRAQNQRVKINKAIIEAGAVEAAPLPPLSAFIPVDETEDPFNGNQNNRRVAERMTHSAKHRNVQAPLFVDDPVDPLTHTLNMIALSKKLDPDPVIEHDYDEPVVMLPPTPGSPAAKAAELAAKTPPASVSGGTAAPVTPAVPPTWKPNA